MANIKYIGKNIFNHDVTVKKGNISGSASSTGSFGKVVVDGVLSIDGFANVSTSLASAVAGGDNLGNHTATQDLNINGNSVINALNISGSFISSGSFGQVETPRGGRVISNITEIFTVTVADFGGNHYAIENRITPRLQLSVGKTYRFDQSDSTNDGHPLRFSETLDGSHGGGSEYTTGVTTKGTPGELGAYTEIKMTPSTAKLLYYYCTSHPGMGDSTAGVGKVLRNDLSDFGGDISGSASSTGSFGKLFVGGSEVSSGGGDVVDDTSPQLGGDLDLNGNSITGVGNVNIRGTITADSYIVSSSVTHMTQSFSSGSTIFGDTLDDTHQFTGSLLVTGSLGLSGFISSSKGLAAPKFFTETPTNNRTQLSLQGSTIFLTQYATFFGREAGSASLNLNTTSNYNGYNYAYRSVFIGTRTGKNAFGSNNTGGGNTFVGYEAGESGTSFQYNTLIGFQSGNALGGSGESANYNTFVGAYTGQNNTDGAYNTLVGYAVGQSMSTTADYNTGIGYQALSNVKGSSTNNVAIGNRVAQDLHNGTNNVFIGYQVALDFKSGSYNIGLGSQAFGDAGLNAYTQTSHNIGMGFQTLKEVGLGSYNLAMGYQAALHQRTGSYNTMIGRLVLGLSNTEGDAGDYNVLIGDRAGYSLNNNPQENVFIGRDSGYNQNSGSYNVFIGSYAGEDFENAEYVTAIGNNAGNVGGHHGNKDSTFFGAKTIASANGNINEHVWGYDLTGKGSNTVTIGNSDVTDIFLSEDEGATVHVGVISGSIILNQQFTGSNLDVTSGSFGRIDATVLSTTAFSAPTGSFGRISSTGAAEIGGVLSIPGITNVSSSIAAAVAGGDNLGNHTATQNVNLGGNSIQNIAHISMSGNISSSLSSTGSFGHLIISGDNFDTAVSSSAAASGFGTGGGSGVSSYDDLTDVPSGIISSSNQLSTSISGSFTDVSSSIASDIAEFKDGTVTLVSGSSTSTGSFGNLKVAGNTDIEGVLSIEGFNNVSSSLAAAVAGGDNLGNHTATTDLVLSSFSIQGANHITASGVITGSTLEMSGTGSFGAITVGGSSFTTAVSSSAAAAGFGAGGGGGGVSSYTDLSDIPTGIVSSSTQIAENISGSFLSTSASIASDISEFKDGTVTLISGSATSTGSFGSGRFIGNVGIGITSDTVLDNQFEVQTSNETLGRFKGTGANNPSLHIDAASGRNPNLIFSEAETIKWYFGNHSSDDRLRAYASSTSYEVFSIANDSTVTIGKISTGFPTTTVSPTLISGSSTSTGSFGTYNGDFIPSVDNTHNLGSSTNRWANAHIGDIELSNEGSSGNEVDGTTGSWTIQEGEDDLYLLNRKNGKKYKFKLEEVE